MSDCRIRLSFYFYSKGCMSKVVAMAEGCLLDPQRLVLFSLLVTAIRILTRWMTFTTMHKFVSNFRLILADLLSCNVANNLLYLQLTDDGYDAQFDQTPGNLSLTKIMKLKCQERKLAERGCIDLGIPINSRWQFSRIEVEGTE